MAGNFDAEHRGDAGLRQSFLSISFEQMDHDRDFRLRMPWKLENALSTEFDQARRTGMGRYQAAVSREKRDDVVCHELAALMDDPQGKIRFPAARGTFQQKPMTPPENAGTSGKRLFNVTDAGSICRTCVAIGGSGLSA